MIKRMFSLRSEFNFQTITHFNNEKNYKPKVIFDYLEKYVIGQKEAKITLSNSYRYRWRRKQLEKELQEDIIPKNILISGPTGSGKTELARKLSKFSNSPFIKVEATNYTEVGYHGKDVDTIIQDLVIQTERKINDKITDTKKILENDIENYINLIILELLIGEDNDNKLLIENKLENIKQGFYDDNMIQISSKLFNGYLNREKYISIEQFIQSLKDIKINNNFKESKTHISIKELKNNLKKNLILEFHQKFDKTKAAIKKVEEDGIIFIDEIDKIANSKNAINHSKGPSTEGVQRDLLPIIEGTNVNIKQGNINTKHILFICAGAFSMAKEDDLLPELLGRLPVRVKLNQLTINDYKNILTKIKYNLIYQYQKLLNTELIEIEFEEISIDLICKLAEELNFTRENLGARRLHSIIEKIYEKISFNLEDFKDDLLKIEKTESGILKIKITPEYIKKELISMFEKVDYKKYVM